jgi:hypothetical protein
MAQVFPLNLDDLSPDEARTSLAGTLAALPDPWTLLRRRQIGDEEPEAIEVVLVHPEIGVALVDEAPRDPEATARTLRDLLDRQRFGEFFPGDLPIVTLSVAPDEFETLGEQLAGAFEAAPRLSIDDPDWADAVIELLMVPDDLAMAPVSDAPPSRTEELPAEDFAAPGTRFEEMRGEHFEEMPGERVEAVQRERFDAPRRDLYDHSSSLDSGEPPLPLMVDWPFAASYERKRRRGRLVALAAGLLLLAGAGVAAWQYAAEDLTVAINDVTQRAQDNPSRSQIEMPLPPQSPDDRAAGKPAASSPPPVPAAPAVVMAQKPYAPPPPAPPRPTPVEPLPQVAVATPPSPPPAAAPPAPERTAAAPPTESGQAPAPNPAPVAVAPPPPRDEPPTQTAAARPPAPTKPAPAAAASPAKPKPAPTAAPTRAAKAEPPPPVREPARRESGPASRTRPIENSDNPPIDAADLPPLDQAPPAPQRPTQFAAPSGSSQPPAGGLGPPVPLWRAQASNPPPPPPAAAQATATEASNRECRPYTSSTTLTGRGLRVEGIACRGTDGQWRLVSEVPLR